MDPQVETISPIHSIVVDDFGIKYVGEENLQHLVSILRESYEISIDKEGTRYVGIHFDWDYKNREVHLSMPGYVKRHSNDSNTNHLQNPKTNHIHTSHQNTEQKYNTPNQRIRRQNSTRTRRNSSKK